MKKGDLGVIDRHLDLVKKGLRPSKKINDIPLRRDFRKPVSPHIYKLKNKKCTQGFSYQFYYNKKGLKTSVVLKEVEEFRDQYLADPVNRV